MFDLSPGMNLPRTSHVRIPVIVTVVVVAVYVHGFLDTYLVDVVGAEVHCPAPGPPTEPCWSVPRPAEYNDFDVHQTLAFDVDQVGDKALELSVLLFHKRLSLLNKRQKLVHDFHADVIVIPIPLTFLRQCPLKLVVPSLSVILTQVHDC